jgi:hypothetical protein
MQKYVNEITTVVDGKLEPLSSATVFVYNNKTTTLATIYADEGVTPLSNPFTSSSLGRIEFYAADGRYDLLISKSGYNSTNINDIILDDPATFSDVLYKPIELSATTRSAESKLRETLSVKDFGAVGDGVVDDSPAFQAAFNYLNTQRYFSLYIPTGVYRLASRVSITVSSGLSDNKNYYIYGDGPSSIIFGDNADGAIRITCTNRHVHMTVSDLTFSPARENSGTAFEYTVPPGGVSNRKIFQMENCTFESHIASDATSSWYNVIVVTGVNRPSFTNVVAWRENTALTPIPNCILNIDGCYSPVIRDCYFNGRATYGISNVCDVTNEGFYISNTIVNLPDTGLYISQPDRHPLLWIVNNHFNNYVNGVSIANSKYIVISGNVMYSRAATGAEYADFLIDNCDSVTITDNVYRASSDTAIPNRRHVSLINGSSYVKIADNGLNARTAIEPFYVGTTSTNIDLYLPDFDDPNYDFSSYPTNLWKFDGTRDNLASETYFRSPTEIAAQNNASGTANLLKLYKKSDTPADGDNLASMLWYGNDSAGSKVSFGQITAKAPTVTAGACDGELILYSTRGGSNLQQLLIGDGLGANAVPRGRGTVTAVGSNSLYYGIGTARGIYAGAGSPEGVVTASSGSLYLNTSGGAGTTLYVKQSGTGNTGWVAK